VVDTVAGEFLPSVSADIHYDQLLADASLSTQRVRSSPRARPNVVLSDVPSMWQPVHALSARPSTRSTRSSAPLKPVVDLLTTQVDIGITKFQFIDLA